jgi:hypothetical protein
MKIVAFEGEGGSHLGVVEGDQVIDLQAADSKVPADLCAWLVKNNGDTKPLGDIDKRALFFFQAEDGIRDTEV